MASLITLEQGSTMTKAYRDANPNDIKGHCYQKEIIQNLLNQEGCEGIRIYYALNAEGKKQLVIVGKNAEGSDMTAGHIIDEATDCPEDCGDQSPLNSDQ